MAAKKRKSPRATKAEYKLAGIICKVLDSDTVQDLVREEALEYREEAEGLEHRRRMVLSRHIIASVGRNIAALVLDALTYMNERE